MENIVDVGTGEETSDSDAEFVTLVQVLTRCHLFRIRVDILQGIVTIEGLCKSEIVCYRLHRR